MMATCSRLAGLSGLLLLASVAALHPSLFSLRELPPSKCGFAHYGNAVGSAQRLMETHLGPGVADWNIVVPMPPPCENAPVTGVDMRVCDADAPPDVSMSDVRSARVHRAGQLAGFAAVNVTVYCILPPPYASPPPPTTMPPPTTLPPPTAPPVTTPPPPTPPPTTPPPPTPPPTTPPPPTPPPTTPPPRTIPPQPTSPLPPSEPLAHLTDSNTEYEMLSNELNSEEVPSNEETSDESESVDLASTELATTVKPTSTTTLPPMQEETTARVELTLPIEVVTHPPSKPTYPQERLPQSMQLTINITPSNRVSTEGGMQSYDVDLPLLSNKETPNKVMSWQNPRFSSTPYIETPPRMSGLPPHKHAKRPRWPGSALLPPPPHPAPSYTPRYAPYYPQYAPQFPRYVPPHRLQPYPLAPLYRPLSLLGPRLRFLQRRQPLLFFQHF